MASIFLSYARPDEAKARKIAAALEGAGHSVWWDQHIGTGARFSTEIDRALRAADMIVVLWSARSIESAWVLDEAGVGRDEGRLVPVMIEDVLPPLGFRQFHALRLTGALRNAKAFSPLLDAVKEGVQPTGPSQPAFSKRAAGKLRAWRSIILVLSVLLLLGAGYALYISAGRQDDTVTVAIKAAELGDRAKSTELAQMVAADLSSLRGGSLGSLSIMSDDETSADYRVEVSVFNSGRGIRTEIGLVSSADSKRLWTTAEEGPVAEFVNFRQRAVAKLGNVLACAVEASAGNVRLSEDALALYLSGCGRSSDLIAFEPDPEVISIFRQLTERAPEFAPGWAYLALIEAQSFPGVPRPDHAALRERIYAHLAKAKRLDPRSPEVMAAEATIHPNDGTKFQHALSILDRGVDQHPDSALLHYMRALFLTDVGRQNEAIISARRAIGLNPLAPSIRDIYISSLAYSGRTGAAYKALEEAESIWPGSAVLEQVRYRLDLRYGNPRAALEALRKRGGGDARPVPGDMAWQFFLEARIEPGASRVERVLNGFRERYRQNNADVPAYLQALGTFDRVDEAYEILKPVVTLDSMMPNTELLFRQHMRSLRADRRFISLAAKLGLLAYWEASGIWPDFCAEVGLPYSCKEEAAKLTPEQRKIVQIKV